MRAWSVVHEASTLPFQENGSPATTSQLNGTISTLSLGSALPRPCMNSGCTGVAGRAFTRCATPFLNCCSCSGSPREPSGNRIRISPRSSASSQGASGLAPSARPPRTIGNDADDVGREPRHQSGAHEIIHRRDRAKLRQIAHRKHRHDGHRVEMRIVVGDDDGRALCGQVLAPAHMGAEHHRQHRAHEQKKESAAQKPDHSIPAGQTP